MSKSPEFAKNLEKREAYCTIRLDVNNHPGVMSHITGLFSRRGFNLEAIVCGRIGVGKTSRMYLLVNRDDKVEQIIHQLDKLYDVLAVTVCEKCNARAFENVASFMEDDSWVEDFGCDELKVSSIKTK